MPTFGRVGGVSRALRGGVRAPQWGCAEDPLGLEPGGTVPLQKKEDCGRKFRPQKSDEPLDRRVSRSHIYSEQMFK